tara:strand:+ start:1413 stop:2372 length:960 start_codon:yes stop_codon:yes gene_type:complete
VSRKPKILVIRLSSIGDIVLTTPVIRCLKLQLNAEVDFLTKSRYKQILVSNPNINRILVFGEVSNESLRSHNYDYVIDLQNNFRTLMMRLSLQFKSYAFPKNNFKRLLLIFFGLNILNDHIVDRYFKAVQRLNVYNDNEGVDYITTPVSNKGFDLGQDYICWSLGGSYENKKLSYKQIFNTISKLKTPVLLIGGLAEKEISKKILNNINRKNVFDLCGEISIDESAYYMQKSKLNLTNDTGMMHIASAFNVPIISFWGCTRPELGFAPYLPNASSVNIITSKSKRPCSKHGQHCKIQANGCIKEIDDGVIFKTIESLLK